MFTSFGLLEYTYLYVISLLVATFNQCNMLVRPHNFASSVEQSFFTGSQLLFMLLVLRLRCLVFGSIMFSWDASFRFTDLKRLRILDMWFQLQLCPIFLRTMKGMGNTLVRILGSITEGYSGFFFRVLIIIESDFLFSVAIFCIDVVSWLEFFF